MNRKAKLMRKCLLLVVIALSVCGCCQIPREALDSLEQNWRLLDPVCRRGIETDPDLSEESKVTRLRNVDEFGALLSQIKEAAK